MTKSKAKTISVADYLTQQINICGKPQKEIAEDVGYKMPNIITMFKQGKTKLPVNKVPAFAQSIGTDPIHMLRIVMSEYMPETWEVIEGLIGKSMVSDSELVILDIIRRVGLGFNVKPETDEERRELAALALKWREREEKNADAARRRVEREKKGSEGKAETKEFEKDIDTLLGLK